MSSSAFALRLATEPVADFTLEQVAREGARRALQKAIDDEVAEYVEAHKDGVDPSNRRLVVRNGHHQPRPILSGVGPIEVHQPRVDDRRVDENGVRFRFTSKILPRYLRKTKAIEELVPWLYLKGISTGEMFDALVHLGFDGRGLSATSVTRMLAAWHGEYEDWSKRRSVGHALRLRVGRWAVLRLPPDRRSPVFAGVNGRDGGWKEGADRDDRRPA